MTAKKYQRKDAHVYFKEEDIKNLVVELAIKERRNFSDMVTLLCEEALKARQKKKLAS